MLYLQLLAQSIDNSGREGVKDTYIYSDTRKWEVLNRWMVSWYITIELIAVFIPLNGV